MFRVAIWREETWRLVEENIAYFRLEWPKIVIGRWTQNPDHIFENSRRYSSSHIPDQIQ
jgi:hypothetical protein